MRGRWAWGWAVAILACRPNVDVDVDVPPDVRYAAVLQFDRDTLVASTPLVRWSEGEGLPVFTDASRRNVVVGYGALELPEDDRPFTEPLASIEAACDERLPAPLWAADLAGASVDVASLGGLTAPWVAEGCVPLDEDFWIENLCGNRRCPIELIASTPCTRTYSLLVCEGPEAVTVRRRPDRSLCATAESDLDACPYVFHDRVSGPAPFTIERRVLVPDQKVEPPERPNPSYREMGTMLDFALVDDALLVAGRDDPNDACENGDARRTLFVLDASDLSVRSTVPVDGCLERLATVAGSGLGVGSTDGEWGLYRYDAAGTETATAAIFSGRITVDDYRVIDLLEDGEHLYVTFGARAGRELVSRFVLVELDPSTLATLRIIDRTEPREPWRAAIRGEYVVVAGLGQQSFVEISLLDDAAGATALSHPYTSAEITDLYVDGATLALSLRQALHVYGERVLRRPVFTQSDIVAIQGWSDDLRLVLELSIDVPVRETEAVFYDERIDRFLPGRWPIGPSIAGRVRTDDAGRVVILLPWAGQIVRLTRAP